MPYSKRLGYRAERSNAWSASKFTNQSSFDPQGMEAYRALDQNRYRIFSDKGLLIKEFPCHQNFIMPLSVREVEETLEKIPTRFLNGLRAIFLLAGSKKQEQTFKGCSVYGFYYSYFNSIILNPFPRRFLTRHYKKLLKPNVLREYTRAGAIVEKGHKGWTISFTSQALKTFYRRDVLIHEIGHHSDREYFRSKTLDKQEGFAEWFATEFGFKYKK